MKKFFFVLGLALIALVNGFDRASADPHLALVRIDGQARLNDLGGKGLYAFSIWSGHKTSFLDSKGNFSIQVLSSVRPQKITLRDQEQQTRALALIAVDDPHTYFVDARSTAVALLLSDPSLIADTNELRLLSQRLESSSSFQELVYFLKNHLPVQSLEALSRDAQYLVLFEVCNRDLFREDRSHIQSILRDAQHQLEQLLQD